MGEFNSSITRVWPVFETLLASDPTGKQWLGELMRLATLSRKPPQSFQQPVGSILPACISPNRPIPGIMRRVLGPDLSAKLGSLPACFEYSLPPPEAFLRWMINHPDQLTWPYKGAEEEVFGDETQKNRKCLLKGGSNNTCRTEALKQLELCGPEKYRSKWWAFEGFTSVDCYLETENYVILIEGKRTELLSPATQWYRHRNQLARNIEVASCKGIQSGKNYAVILCTEDPVDIARNAITGCFPHLSKAEGDELVSHYLGCVTWSQIVSHLCPAMTLPNRRNEAVDICLKART